MKTAYILLLVVAFVQLSKQNSCHWREMELCPAAGLLALQTNPIPQSEEEIDNLCVIIKEAVECGANYTSKCSTPLYKQLISFATAESHENMNNFCTPGHELRKTLLKHAACLLDVWKDQKTCTDDARAAIEKISAVSNKDRINLACCTYRRFRLCGTSYVENKCGAEAKDFIMKFISFFASNLPDIVCQSFTPEDPVCKPLLPPIGTKPTGNNDTPLNQLLNMFGNN